MMEQARTINTELKWRQLCDSFGNRYALMTKQTKISNWLDSLKIKDVKAEGEDNYEAVDKLTARINQLVPMARIKDRDDEAKVRFL